MHIPEKKYKWLIFPIENYVREFDGKFLLSAVAAERGWGTILAYKGQIRHNLPDINGVLPVIMPLFESSCNPFGIPFTSKWMGRSP